MDFQTIFDELSEVIRGTKLLIDYYNDKSSLKSTIYGCIDWAGSAPQDRELVEKKFINVNLPQKVYFNSQYLILCASYENFIISFLKCILLKISETKDFSKIPHALRNINTSYSGSLLSSITGEKKSHVRFKTEDLIKNLYLLNSKDNSFKLNIEIAELVPSVLLFEKVIDFIQKCDLEIGWTDITDNTIFKDEYKGNKTERKNIAVNMHKDIYRIRNRIAHTGCSSAVVIGELEDLLKFLTPFNKSLINVVETEINKVYL
ncbi:hypothetical protein EVU94_05355 [Flavobacteriaceae bacterium 144Ye]|nr:hypothetical protein EVU94_05355 [Flavobacteriaceae bacterium 144Ye]